VTNTNRNPDLLVENQSTFDAFAAMIASGGRKPESWCPSGLVIYRHWIQFSVAGHWLDNPVSGEESHAGLLSGGFSCDK